MINLSIQFQPVWCCKTTIKQCHRFREMLMTDDNVVDNDGDDFDDSGDD